MTIIIPEWFGVAIITFCTVHYTLKIIATYLRWQKNNMESKMTDFVTALRDDTAKESQKKKEMTVRN